MLMAESKKGTSSITDLRKKNTLLDEDIDDEFMKSWKSISVTKADTVDFSFDTVSKSKNKAFDFGPLDVDFNLDGSFEKLSSFKLDMADLDFSCLPKKTSKARSSCIEEPANENHQKHIDALNFSFDFKELDDFDVDKSLEDRERTCNQKQDTKAVSSSRVECEGSKIHITEENTAFDNSIPKKLPASGNETSSKVETFRGDYGELESEGSKIHVTEENTAFDNSVTKKLPVSGTETSSKVETFLGDHGELESEVIDGTANEASNAEQTTNEEERFEKSCLSENDVSKSSHPAIPDIPNRYIVRNDAPECTTKLQPEISIVGVELSEVSGGSENVKNEMTDSDGTFCENLPQNNTSPINLPAPESNHEERENSGRSSLNEVVDNIQLAEGDLNVKDSSNPDVSRKLFLDTQEFRGNQNLKLKLPMVSLCRGPLINKVTAKENEMGGNSSMPRADVDTKPQSHQSSSIRMKILSFGNDRTATGEGAKVNPSNSCVKINTQTHFSSENLKLSMVPNRSSKIISAQETKLCSTKTSSKFPNLSSLKISRDFGGKRVQSSAGADKEREAGDTEQNMEAGRRIKAPDIGCCAENAEKRKLLVSNLKRKVLEAPYADSMLLKPLKRLSVSPCGIRNLKEPSEKKTEQVEGMTINASHDQLASSIGNPHLPNTMELEISLVLENDQNVKKAEAYTKELEDICNMMRKKHDEAKELLVRVVVNNNNLLMLNHPIYEEKIRMVQKFAAKLLSKELQAKAA